VLPPPTDGQPPAHLYLEGSDQHRGWFQSSLITSVALTGRAPYKTVVTHGFVLDENGKKMSKSLGNVIEPSSIVNPKPTKATSSSPASSAGAGRVDLLRLWVSSSDYTHDTVIGPVVLEKVLASLRRLRNTARFLLGNLHDFPRSAQLPYSDLEQVDKYMLHKLFEFSRAVEEEYEAYQFSKVYRLLVNFATIDLSAFYFEISKDNLYANQANSRRRRACQTVLRQILDSLTLALAPIACFTAQEINTHDPYRKYEDIFQNGWLHIDEEWNQPNINSSWEIIRKVRTEVNRVLEAARADKAIGSSLEGVVRVHVPPSPVRMALQTVSKEELSDVFGTSAAELGADWDGPKNSGDGDYWVGGVVDGIDVAVHLHRETKNYKCPRCWKYTSPQQGLCSRCASILAS